MQMFGSGKTHDGQQFNAILNIDEDLPNEAMVHVWGDSIREAILFNIEKAADQWELSPKVFYSDSEHGLFAPIIPDEKLKALLPARAHLRWEGNFLTGNWYLDDTRRGQVAFQMPLADKDLELPQLKVHTCDNWDDFKRWAGNARAEHNLEAYRGHGSNAFQLSTTLHRTGRVRLERYCHGELNEFHSHAEAVLGLRLDLSKTDDYSTVLGLAQHHGLPTPLLDWTKSPYIAAFFAFADAVEHKSARPGVTHVRVFALSKRFIKETSPAVITVPHLQPYVCCLSIAPRHNARLYAQQGLFIVTNVNDMALFIRLKEKSEGIPALYAVDIPVSCAAEALEDLAFMGLTAATLFPGMDGVGRMLRTRMLAKR
jgi:hypothetical protein